MYKLKIYIYIYIYIHIYIYMRIIYTSSMYIYKYLPNCISFQVKQCSKLNLAINGSQNRQFVNSSDSVSISKSWSGAPILVGWAIGFSKYMFPSA